MQFPPQIFLNDTMLTHHHFLSPYNFLLNLHQFLSSFQLMFHHFLSPLNFLPALYHFLFPFNFLRLIPYFFKKFGTKTIISFTEILEVNIQHSICVRILFPFIAYTRDDLCRIIRDHFQSFGKGCRIIRRVEFLEVRYSNRST